MPNAEPGTANAANTVKLTGPVKVVQVPVAGQPGKYVTGLLPVIPQTHPSTQQFEQTDTAKDTKGGPRKFWMMMILTMLVVLVILSTGASYWYLHARLSQGAKQSPTATSPTIPSNIHATATAQAQATTDANLILTDALKTNIHNFPVGKNEFFKGGAYHIVNTDGSAVAVVLPEMPFSIPNAYTLTMWEVKGDDTSNNNSFGMIVRFNQQKNQAGKVVTTFYSFEVLNTGGGEYRFYKYDDNQPSSDRYWTQLWSKPFGSEFHQGQGPKNVNTIRIYQNGSSFSFTVNGTIIGTTHDSSFKSGTVGMLVNLKGTEVAFMNMVITHK